MASPRRPVLLALILAIAIAGMLVLLLMPSSPGGPAKVVPEAAHEEAVRATAPAPTTRATEVVPTIRPTPAPVEEEVAASKPAASTGIRGRVVTKEGAPVAGARVTVEPALDYGRDRISRGEGYTKVFPPVGAAVSDSAGRFEIAPLHPRQWAVACEKEGFGWERTDVHVLRDRIAEVEIAVEPARQLAGEVVDAGGAPVPRAEVFVESHLLRRKVADELGRFTIDVPGTFRTHGMTIRALKEGVGIGTETFTPPALPPSPARIPLYRTRRLICRFQPDDGSPPPANVRFSVSTEILPRHFVFVGTTDQHGAGTVTTWPEVDMIRVITDDPGWCLPFPGGRNNSHVGAGVDRPVAPLGDASIDVPITRTGTLSGSVVDRASGKPVPGVPIQAIPRGSQPIAAGRHHLRNAVTDERGEFRFDGLQRAETAVTVRSTRWLVWPDGWNGEPLIPRAGFERTKFFGQHPLHQTASVEGVVVKVVEAGTVEGVVLDAAGAPVDAAEVDAGLEIMDPRTQVSIEGRHYRDDFAARTDAEGRFVLTGLYPSATCRIRARRPNTPWTWSEPFDLAAGATRSDLRIVLPAGKTLVVSVLGPDGASIPGAEVSVTEGEHPPPGVHPPFFRERTGKDGSATFVGLAAGRVTVSVDPDTVPDGLQSADGPARVFDLGADGVNRATINLQPAIYLTGTVQLGDGPFPGPASITAVPVGLAAQPAVHAFGKIAADGSFSIRVSSSSPHTIRDISRITYVPRGAGASLDHRIYKFVPAKKQELRPGEPAVVVVRPG
jgi:uncharacterized GH25 family protein